MRKETEAKYYVLREYLKNLGSIAVAYSSGVDSTFLLKTAHDVLGDKCIAITARSEIFPSREKDEAAEFVKREGIRHFFIDAHQLDSEIFCQNPANRCYLCKKELFTEIVRLAADNGIEYVAEGSNMDDNGDFRPGMQAIKELEVKSPLRYAKLYKEEIREISRELGLDTADKPSFACLASRFVYGEQINAEKLEMVEKGEQLLMNMGFKQFRVRIHGNLARIEVYREDFDKFMEHCDEIQEKLKGFGFAYVTLDLKGFRSGSMNEVLSTQTKKDAAEGK